MELQAGRNSLKLSLEYSQASLKDLAVLSELILEFKNELNGMLFSEEDLLACPQSPGSPLCHLKESLQSHDSYVALARSLGKVIAFIKFDRGQTSKSRHRGVFTMAVKESHWGLGVGRSLLRSLEAWAAQQGILRLELNVLETNIRAIRLYQSEGYVFEGYKESAALVGKTLVGGYVMAKLLFDGPRCNEKL